MFELYFRRSNGEDKFLANCKDMSEVNKVIKNFLDEHNYKSYYSRMWISAPGHLKIDVGSHTEFFIVKGAVEELLTTLISEEE